MKRSIILTILLATLLSGCMSLNMKFQPSADLKSSYDQVSRGKDITVYYNVKESVNSKNIEMAVQNTGKIYMSNLIINYDECCQLMRSGPGTSKFKNLGNLKNRSHKTMNLNIPKETKGTIKLSYSYTPVQEDGFMVSSNTYTPTDKTLTINNEVILYIGQ